ncbi:hypothetical protein D3C72_2185860 [compost metagenome]
MPRAVGDQTFGAGQRHLGFGVALLVVGGVQPVGLAQGQDADVLVAHEQQRHGASGPVAVVFLLGVELRVQLLQHRAGLLRFEVVLQLLHGGIQLGGRVVPATTG